jgi:DNA uptake protein ComE-like DNA-binding protein
MSMATISFAAGEKKPVATGIGKPTLAVKTGADKQKKNTASTKKVDPIDINSASAKQLKQLPGLTSHDVKKIIAGRPYSRKEDLKWKQIITEPAYNVIEATIIAKQSAKPVKPAQPVKPVKPVKSTKPAK